MNRRPDVAADSGDVDDGDVRVGAAEPVEERGVVVHRADEDHPVVAFECGSSAVDDLRLGLEHQDADWTDRINHRGIPKDWTR